jgi:ADP-ribose pyrophosphatase
MKSMTETRLSTHEQFKGHILRVRLDTVTIFNGQTREREVVEHPGGVAILAQRENGHVLLIRQFRYALQEYLYEFPAGKREPDMPQETPLLCAQRELEEETGYRAQTWKEVLTLHPAPGFCDEKIVVFHALNLASLPHPQRDEDEQIEVLEKSPDELWQMVDAGKISDAKTLAMMALILPRESKK